MTDPQHLQQLIQVEDERVEKMVQTLAWESAILKGNESRLSLDTSNFAFIENALNALKHHLTRRDTLRELLNK